MKKEENITLTPFNEGMTYEQNSWLVINVQSYEKTEVIFYTASQDNEESFVDFKDFSGFMIDEKFGISSNDTNVTKEINDKKSTVSGCLVTEEDYDDEKCFKILVSKGQIIDIYQNIPFDDIGNLVKEAKKALKSLESGEKETYNETQEYKKDPYAYYGVSRSDFF